MKPSEALAAHRTELRELFLRHGLERPRDYGSVLNGTDTEESDLDLLADAMETTTLFMLARLEHAAQELLGGRVSILTPGFLEHIAQAIQRATKYIELLDDVSAFRQSRRDQDAVIRNIEIIGEATR